MLHTVDSEQFSAVLLTIASTFVDKSTKGLHMITIAIVAIIAVTAIVIMSIAASKERSFTLKILGLHLESSTNRIDQIQKSDPGS